MAESGRLGRVIGLALSWPASLRCKKKPLSGDSYISWGYMSSAKIVGRGGPGTEPDDPVVRAFDERRLRHATKASTVLFWVFKVGKEDPTTFNAWFLANEAALDGPFHIP